MTYLERTDPEDWEDDPAFVLPLPPSWALDQASRMAGFTEWFAVPTLFRTPTNRAIIVQARLIAKAGTTPLSAECRERASYLKAMEPEGLSHLEWQCMETLFRAAVKIERLSRDSDESPEGRDATRLDSEAATARAEGIAQGSQP